MRRRFFQALAIGLLCLPACRNTTGPAARPSTWATPVALNGLPNLHRVSPTLYRAAQPTAEGLAAFAQLGGRSVVNFRESDTDKKAIAPTGLAYAWHPTAAAEVSLDDVQWFLRYANDPAHQPLLVHCKHGADRTGVMIAAYRIVIEDWSKQDAIAEMTTGGFDFHPMWQNLITLIHQMDVDAMRTAIAQP